MGRTRVKNARIPCFECGGKRLARYADGKCEPCHFRTVAEGTQKTLAQQVRDGWRKEARLYNKLVRSGLDQRQAAEKMGIDVHKLRTRIYKWKTLGGIAVIPMGRPTIHKPKVATTTIMQYPARGHGIARWGVKGCHCEPCVTVREIHRAIMKQRVAQGKATQ